MSVFGVLERLNGFVDEMVALDPACMSEPELADALLGARRLMDRLDGVFARLARAGHVRGVGAADGAVSTAAWLRYRAGMREGDTRASIDAGAVCELLGETGAAWRSGDISTGAARTIAAARVEGHDDRLVECEPVFLEFAREHDLRSLGRATAHFRNLARANGREPRVPDGLHCSKTYANRTVLSGEFGDLAAETITTALTSYTDPPSDTDPQPLSERTAAAFVRICEAAIAHLDDEGRPSAHVSAVFDWATLTAAKLGRCDGGFTGPIHPDDVRRLLCDCTTARVVTGPASEILDVGRSRRTVPPSLRRALVVRDGGCKFPGCNRPPAWCDAHHYEHWIDGGHTNLENLGLFCTRHHHRLHEDDWTTIGSGGDIRIFRPDGIEVT